MTKDQMEQLTEVVLERYGIHRDNPEDMVSKRTGTMYTPEEFIEFAIEEAWENGELDFLTVEAN